MDRGPVNFRQRSKKCGSDLPTPLVTTGETLIKFRSDYTVTRRGFHLRYEILSCGGLITQDFTELKSPTHLGRYGHNLNCTWTIQAPPGKVVELKYDLYRRNLMQIYSHQKKVFRFNKLEMEIHSRCNFDYVAAFNGNSTRNEDQIGKYCGNQTTVPPTLKSESNILTLQFKTDYSINGEG